MEISERPSPNFGERAGGLSPSLVVLHYTAMDSAEAALERLCDKTAEVSTHYLISRDGEIFRLVKESMRAWHAGAGFWAGKDDVNSRSIGIELDNDGQSAFPAKQMAALDALLGEVMARHEIEPKGVIGHSDMAPTRKIDPGRLFDWQRLAAEGLAVWPDPALPGEYLRNAAAIGNPESYGEAAVHEAFRQRFRPSATGPMDPADQALMAGLAKQHPADVTERFGRRLPSRPFSSLT